MTRFSGDICGIPVAIHSQGTVNIWEGADSYKNTLSQKITLTAENGQSVVIQAAGQGNSFVIENLDGSVTVTDRNIGLPEKLFIPNGPPLSLDAGFISFETTFDAAGNVISSEIAINNGPHPEAESEFALLCEVLTDALT
jgi:hypothetical protein